MALIPTTDSDTPEASAALLMEIEGAIGMVSNLHRSAATAPAALHSLWSQMQTSTTMVLSERIQVAIALRVAELHENRYCLVSHAVAARKLGIDAQTIQSLRRGRSGEIYEATVLALVTKIFKDRGHHTGLVVDAARSVGVTAEALLELITLVARFTFENYLSKILEIEIEFKTTDESSEIRIS